MIGVWQIIAIHGNGLPDETRCAVQRVPIADSRRTRSADEIQGLAVGGDHLSVEGDHGADLHAYP